MREGRLSSFFLFFLPTTESLVHKSQINVIIDSLIQFVGD